MKALVYSKYGSPDVLHLEEVEQPVVKGNEVLIKVHASSVNDWDWGLLRGKPFLARLPTGLFKPTNRILGADVAGTVEAVGADVTNFQPGDDVFGDISGSGWGGFAEYVCARESVLTLKPAGMAFDEAAAMPQAGVLGLSGIRDLGVQSGQNVLINGAGGGAGTFAVQIAKHFGAEVTGVDSGIKLDVMRSVGADHVIDYTQEDFTKNGLRYNLILDMAAHHSVFDYKRALAPGGRYLMEGGATGRIFQILLVGSAISVFGRKKMGLLMLRPNRDLDMLVELYEAGAVTPAIDKRFPLDQGHDAFRYFGAQKTRGKIVITM